MGGRARETSHLSREPRLVLDGGFFFESPRWHDGRLYVSDFFAHTVSALDLQGGVEIVARIDAQPSGIGWLPDGDALIVSMRDRRLLRIHDGTLRLHADLSAVATGHANDMTVDARGRAYVGNFGFDLATGSLGPAALARVDPDGTVAVAAADLLFPNGVVITPDGSTLIVAETYGRRLTAFDVADDGGLSNRRTWADLSAQRVAPDGIALDEEGYLWVADARGARAVRVREGGTIVDEIRVDAGVYACALAGGARTTLVLCAAPTYVESEAAAAPGARLLAYDVDVPGVDGG